MKKINFDTLSYVDELKEGGFKQGPAEAVTKATIKATREIFEGLDLATKTDITDLKIEMLNLKVEFHKSMFRMFIATVGILATIQAFLKFYPGH